MKTECQRHYARGYYAGSRGAWPEHRPPHPPMEMVAKFMEAAKNLRDEMDSELAKFGPDDEIEIALAPFIDAFDDQCVAITRWIKDWP